MTNTEADRPTARLDPDRLAELEEERRFLLRSIADLEREREAGDVEDDDYHALRDGYTARAAVVLRAIDQGRSGLRPKPPRNWTRLIGSTLAVIIVGVVAGVLVARSSGQRDPGDTITGGTSPNQVATLLSEGRSFLEVGDFGEASNRYLAVLDIDANNVEALSYAGWVLAVSTQSQTDATTVQSLIAQGKEFLDKAAAIDPTYADAKCFQAIIAVVFEDDLTTGAAREAECMANNPSADMRGLVEAYVSSALAPPDDTSTAETVTSSTG